MMGQKPRLFTPLPPVTIEELVPADHFHRHLDRVLDLTFVRDLLRDLVRDCYIAGIGRPSVDPVVFFQLQLVMFFEGIRSERQLLRLAADRLSVLWYLGYTLDEALPDHSSLTRIRARYGRHVFRRFFDAIVEQCRQAGLVGGRELYFDATQVQADAALDSLTARFAVEAREAPKAVEAHLTTLFTDSSDEGTPPSVQSPPYPSSQPVEPRESTVPTPLPACLAAEQREALETANTGRHDWIAQEGRPQREVRGVYQRTADLRISTTDPDATPMRLKGGGTHLGYQTHYVVDGGGAQRHAAPVCRQLDPARLRAADEADRGVGRPIPGSYRVGQSMRPRALTLREYHRSPARPAANSSRLLAQGVESWNRRERSPAPTVPVCSQ